MTKNQIDPQNEKEEIFRTSIRNGLLVLAVIFVLLSCAFSADYLRGTSNSVSNASIVAVVVSLLSVFFSIIL